MPSFVLPCLTFAVTFQIPTVFVYQLGPNQLSQVSRNFNSHRSTHSPNTALWLTQPSTLHIKSMHINQYLYFVTFSVDQYQFFSFSLFCVSVQTLISFMSSVLHMVQFSKKSSLRKKNDGLQTQIQIPVK